jgi:formate--tetrahydrofolate ligase
MHAIGAAHNLLAAMLDNRLHWQNRGPAKHGANDPQIDGRSVEWGRVLDMNERALRSVIVALDPAGAGGNGVTRQSRFDITVASEVMAILCLATDMGDLQRRLGNIVVGRSKATAAGDSQIVTAKDIGADGAMAALLRDALQPNIVQSLEGNLGFVHGGPFANIAHGCSTVLATKAAMAMGEYVVTEGGFGADLGAEKFLNIKCRKSGIAPSAAVVVATTRALKLHGGGDDAAAVAAGMPNLLRHCENLSKFGLPVVVAVNKFKTDTADELDAIKSGCAAAGIDAIESTHWAHGGAGAADLAQAVVDVVEAGPTTPKLDFLYPDSMPLKEKLETLAREIYRADGVAFSSQAATKLKRCVCPPPPWAHAERVHRKGAYAVSATHARTLRVSRLALHLCGAQVRKPGLRQPPRLRC